MRKILFVIDVMRKGGGAQKVIAILLPLLQEKGFFVELIVLKKTTQLLEIPGVRVHYILESEENTFLVNTFYILEKLVAFFKQFDIVCSFMDFITGYFVALGAKLSSKPYYAFVRCEPSFVAVKFTQPQINFDLYALCLQNAQKVICNSKSSCLDVEKNFKVKKKNIYLLYNPIDTKQILEKSKEPLLKIELQKHKDEIFCLSVGRLHPQKNYDTLLKAFLKLKDSKIKLFILGDGEQKLEMENFIQKHRMKNVQLLGYQANIYPFLKQTDIFVHCSLYEGFPNAVLEAAFFQKPLILSDIPTHREIFSTKGAEFFNAKDVDRLVALVKKLACDSKERARLSKGVSGIIKEYQNESFEKKLEEIFVLGKPSENEQ